MPAVWRWRVLRSLSRAVASFLLDGKGKFLREPGLRLQGPDVESFPPAGLRSDELAQQHSVVLAGREQFQTVGNVIDQHELPLPTFRHRVVVPRSALSTMISCPARSASDRMRDSSLRTKIAPWSITCGTEKSAKARRSSDWARLISMSICPALNCWRSRSSGADVTELLFRRHRLPQLDRETASGFVRLAEGEGRIVLFAADDERLRRIILSLRDSCHQQHHDHIARRGAARYCFRHDGREGRELAILPCVQAMPPMKLARGCIVSV